MLSLNSCSSNEAALQNAKKLSLKTETSDDFKKDLDKMFAHYSKLTLAMVNQDIEQIRKTAQPFLMHMSAIDINLLNDQQQLDWNLKSEMIVFSLEEIKQYDQLPEIRTNYKDLSETMIEALKDFGISAGNAYIFHCPKAMDGKGAMWVSLQTELDNPYGSKNCGTITEHITIE